MTAHAPMPNSYSSTTTRTRVKWDNILIVIVGIAVAAGVAAFILASPSPHKAVTPTKPTAQAPQTDATAAPATDDGALDLTDAQGLVDEAKDLMGEARWDEALDRLQTVPEQFRAQVGSTDLETQVQQLKTSYTDQRAKLDAAIQARQWKDAGALITSLLAIAPNDPTLLEAQDMIKTSLAIAAAPAAGAKDDDATADAKADATKPKATATGGGATTPTKGTSKPAGTSTTHKPSTTKPNHATTTGGGSSSRPASGSNGGAPAQPATNPSSGAGQNVAGIDLGSLSGGNLQLTKDQQDQLEAALQGVLNGGDVSLG